MDDRDRPTTRKHTLYNSFRYASVVIHILNVLLNLHVYEKLELSSQNLQNLYHSKRFTLFLKTDKPNRKVSEEKCYRITTYILFTTAVFKLSYEYPRGMHMTFRGMQAAFKGTFE